VLRSAVDRARLGEDDRLAALRRLDTESRRLERAMSRGELDALLIEERERSHERGGMSVFGPEPPPRKKPTVPARRADAAAPRQLSFTDILDAKRR